MKLVQPHRKKNTVIKVGSQKVLLNIEEAEFRKTDNTGTETQIEIRAYQLAVPTTGGTTATNANIVNLDLESDRASIGLTVLQDVTYDLTGALQILIVGSTVNKSVRNRVSVTSESLNFSLKCNTEYLVISKILEGATGTSESFLMGDFSLVCE